MADAAQEFLDKQLSKNRFTAKQQERLDASGGAAVVNASEGFVPPGEAYAKYGKMPGTESSDSPSTTTTAAPTATSTWDGKNYSQGAFNADDLKKHFGLQDGTAEAGYNASAGATDDDKAKDNDLLGKGYLSNDKYESLKGDSKIKEAYAALHGQSAADKKFEDGSISINAMDSLFDDLTARANTETAVEAEPEKERTPIEHSPEVKQAKERVRAYEDNIMSGKTSEDIFGDFDASSSNIGTNKWSNNMDRINDKYQMDLNAGAAGIGTSTSGAQAEAPAKAADSFLTSQKSAIKKDYGFKPSYTYASVQPTANTTKNSFVPNYSYGDN